MARSSFATALAIMSGAGLLAGTAGQALADQDVLASQPFSASSTSGSGGSDTLTFAGFDTSLGTLTEVDVSLRDVTTGETYSVTAMFGAEGGAAAQTDSFLIQDATPSTLIGSPPQNVGTNCGGFDCVSGPGSSPSLTLSDFAPNPDVITGGDVTEYETTDVDLSAVITQTLNNSCTPNIDGSCSFTNGATFSGDLQVTYDYTPTETTVPEPPSLVLLGMGLLGLGFTLRRKLRAVERRTT